MNDWLGLGPFHQSATATPCIEESFGTDYLHAENPTETEQEISTVACRAEERAECKNGLRMKYRASTFHFDDPVPNFDTFFTSARYSCVYLAAEIDCDVDREVALITGGRDAYRIWLNGTDLGSVSSVRWIEKYTAIVPVALKKGRNRLLVKVVRGRSEWGFVCSMVGISHAISMEQRNSLVCLLKHQLVSSAHDLEPGNGATSIGRAVDIRLTDSAGCTIEDNLSSVRGFGIRSTLPPGLYTLSCSILGRRYKENIFLGDIGLFCSRVSAESRMMSLCSIQDRINMEAPLRRVEVLSVAKNRHAEKCLGEIEAVHWIGEIEKLKRDLIVGACTYRTAPGLHLRAYISKTDKSVQYYMVYAPTANGVHHKRPLLVVYPDTAKSRPQFLKSYILDYKDVVDAYQAAADCHELVVVWPYARDLQHSAKGDAEVFEAIGAVETDYDIDSRKVYVTGICASGRDAIMLAARHPSFFAAVGVTAPSISGDSIDDRRNTGETAAETSPSAWIENLRNVPLLIVHGDHDSHMPIDNSVGLFNDAKAAGVKCTFCPIAGATEAYFPERDNEPIFEIAAFCAGKIHDDVPNELTLITDSNSDHFSDWLSIVPYEQTRGYCNCKVDADGTINIAVKKVKRVSLNLRKMHFRVDRVLRVRINGVDEKLALSRNDTVMIDVCQYER